jgi:hypothetical protein
MDEPAPFLQRAVGSALVTGAAAATFGLAFARPVVREAIHSAGHSSSPWRTSTERAARDVGQAALESARPLVRVALDAKDRARRRAVGSLSPGLGAVAEAWRHDLIEVEKSLYYGGRQALADTRPRAEQACDAGVELAHRLLDVFDEVVDAGLAATATLGEDLQQPRRAPSAPARRRRATPAKRRKRR